VPSSHCGVCAAGMALSDFVDHPTARRAHLDAAHVVALRVYTTAAYQALNAPFRDAGRSDAHPLPATITFLTEAIKRLRAVDADSAFASSEADLWRGLHGTSLDDEYLHEGWTELGPMSTTTSLEVAIRYSISRTGAPAVLLRSLATSFMQRGADLSFLSAFPSEAEVLFPPLTFLEVKEVHRLAAGGRDWTVVDFVPHLGT